MGPNVLPWIITQQILASTSSLTSPVSSSQDWRGLSPKSGSGGRFLRADSTTPATPFKLPPLQAYFADVYAKLQTDLQISKERCIQLDYDYELERALRKQVKADLRVEISLRKGCELQLKTAESQLNEERAKVTALEAARHQDNLALDQARRELKETQELLGKIGLLVRSDKQTAIPVTRCI